MTDDEGGGVKQCHQCPRFRRGLAERALMKGGKVVYVLEDTGDSNHGWCDRAGERRRWNDACTEE